MSLAYIHVLNIKRNTTDIPLYISCNIFVRVKSKFMFDVSSEMVSSTVNMIKMGTSLFLTT